MTTVAVGGRATFGTVAEVPDRRSSGNRAWVSCDTGGYTAGTLNKS